jgi:hypothetical protein
LSALAAAKNGSEILLQCCKRRLVDSGAWDHDNIEWVRGWRVGLPEHLSNQSFSAISRDGPPQFPRRNDPEPRGGRWRRGRDDRQKPAVCAPSLVQDALKFAPPAKTPRRWERPGQEGNSLSGGGNGEALASLCATALQHKAAILGGHSDQEAMGALPAPAIRLVRTLHDVRNPAARGIERRNTNSNERPSAVSINSARQRAVCHAGTAMLQSVSPSRAVRPPSRT